MKAVLITAAVLILAIAGELSIRMLVRPKPYQEPDMSKLNADIEKIRADGRESDRMYELESRKLMCDVNPEKYRPLSVYEQQELDLLHQRQAARDVDRARAGR